MEISREFALKFAQAWVDAWNAHDLDRVLAHYTEDMRIETPMAANLVPGSNGVVQGKEAVRRYWAEGLRRIPGLHFELLEVFVGVEAITIYYINTATSRKSVENMWLNAAGQVVRAAVMYT